jgi:hypothetical protein
MNSTMKLACAPLLLALLASLGGCAGKTPRLDRQFGSAVTAARQAQIINPAPPASLAVNGLDGQASKSAYEAYQQSFKVPEPQTGALTIGVGR